MLVSSCTRLGGNETVATAHTHHHELRFAGIGDVTTLNPMLSSDLNVTWLSQLTMAYLIRYDRANRPIPEIATAVPSKSNGLISPDGKTITYRLRHGVTWSDGVALNADDVIFSTRLAMDGKTNIAIRSGWDRIARVDEPDKYTVVFHLRAPYGQSASTFFSTGNANPAVMPEHLLAHTKSINTDPYNALPIGAGPFTYVRWARGDRVELQANTKYWRGRPKLERVVYRIIPSRDTLLAALQTGEIDLWLTASAAYYERASRIPGYRVVRQASYGYGHLDFNLSHKIVADRAVRKALEFAFDRRTQHDKISHGLGVLQDSVMSPAAPFYDRTLGFTEYDPAKANALLDGAGWKRGADGIRAKNGLRLNLELVSNTGSPDTDQRIELLRDNWRQVGVGLVRKNIAPALLFASYADGGTIFTGKFDAVFLGTSPTASLSFADAYSCDANPPAGQNVLHWCDPVAQRAIDRFIATYDPNEQRRDSLIVQRRLVETVPTIVTSIADDIFVENRNLTGYHPNQVTFFDDMMNVDI